MNRLVLACALSLATVASADLIIGPEAECREKKAGDACRADTGAGVCTAAKCSRNDYSDGVPPKQKIVDCLKCLEATAPGDAGVAATKKKAKK